LSSSPSAPILLFNGEGTSPNDVIAIEAVLAKHQLAYATADSAELDGLSETQLGSFRLLIVPGGNFERMGNALLPSTSVKIRGAVQKGLNYLGVCAGAFFAGNSPYNGLNLTAGKRFEFYSAERNGIRKAALPISSPNGPTLDQYWEDGPELFGWGAAVAKYPDGTPAVVQGPAGKGWVVLVGFHPEAPQSWREGMRFTTPVSESSAYAATLVDAALSQRVLPQF
jgi:glutamine amidotransferase-like uncharacterized protein